ncbi:SpoIIE family protein phosphatase [Desulfonema magnum]|uniref:PPM-type phosphatase domain-containing protein n=1 Tax=Desulfonema magnum TaxID=45655 RepID=A0A975BRI1_9BACT|nr:SpoIIE family protein phosphatase [Desulfonema magnum]QTA90361.1 PPM-type phosphatase domain-containing protein [Desulfonema magnum]
MTDESFLADVFNLLDILVAERGDDASFQLLGTVPECLKPFFPQAVPGKRFRPEENSPFLENFLIDAEDCWTSENTEPLKSGAWAESDDQGNSCELEATAIFSGKRKLLLVEPARYSQKEKQFFIQKSRELSLAYHRLEQTEAELKKSKEAAEAANRKVMESIQYAKMIQRSLLPDPDRVKCYFPHSFFIWMPRDILGGDILFFDSFEDGIVGAVIDCTGHGVPGAFMTMIASSGLRRIIRDEGCRDPSEILRRLNFIVKTSLQQDTGYALSDDGMDAGIFSIQPAISDQKTEKQTTDAYSLTFAGARLPLIYIHNGEVCFIKGDRQSIGYKRSDLNFNFTNHKITIDKNMSFYIFTDGFTDQLGGERDRRFGSRRFRNLLKENARLPFEKQRDVLLQAFNAYQGENERQDDVTVAGFCFDELIFGKCVW